MSWSLLLPKAVCFIGEIDLRYPKPPVDPLALNNDVDRYSQQSVNVITIQISPTVGFFHEKRQLLEGEFGGIGVNGGDRPRVAGVDIADVVEGRAVAQLL